MLPSDKAPGPDKIPNQLLKNCSNTFSKFLTELFNACLILGYHPKAFRESITTNSTTQHDGKNLGKILEKLVATRISKAAEEHNLLPEEQMGARPKRSTITAVELITEQVHAIWGKDKARVASLLSLDIAGAFDNVSHTRLIHNLREKGIPRWTTNFIESFLSDRTTSIALGKYRGEQMSTSTGIPQGFPLSPILFLFFASTFLPMLQTANLTAVGFVDDTNILTWSNSTEENCRNLERQHEKCEIWAKRHGVKFAPEKYQLIHFSRARKKHNLAATVSIQGHLTNPQASLRILGIHLDLKLKWGAHVKQVEEKAGVQMQAMSRLTQLTWGATFKKAKLIYSAIVRPALMYGSSIWAEYGRTGNTPERSI
ncbi:hypothetical protein K3495_g13017 [Podosphaera aphanis]|nr:hypothetical protein K3495_g13017 [Podosphaera aphanis]